MTCLYSQADDQSRCKEEVERLGRDVSTQSLLNGGTHAQYVNTLTCQVNDDLQYIVKSTRFENADLLKNVDIFKQLMMIDVMPEIFQLTVCCKTAYFCKTEYENRM